MSCCLGVEGIIPPDDEYRKMRAVYFACQAAKVPTPKEVSAFFGYNEPNNNGTLLYLGTLTDSDVFYNEEDNSHIKIVDLDKLHKKYPGVKKIRIRCV